MSESDAIRVTRAFQKALDVHGHGFQYSVLQEAARLNYDIRSSGWLSHVAEFPVEVQSFGTRIDLILKHVGTQLYMIGECKRVNPALSNWCFIKASLTPAINQANELKLELVRVEKDWKVFSGTQHLTYSQDVYHVGVETKSDDKGDSGGTSSRSAIEEACTQLSRGVNGFIEFLKTHSFLLQEGPWGFIPVIFTTARLWATPVDLNQSNLVTGKLDLSQHELVEKHWIFYQYHQSPGLRHSVPAQRQQDTVESILYDEYVRTIIIVNSAHIPEFLETSSRWVYRLH